MEHSLDAGSDQSTTASSPGCSNAWTKAPPKGMSRGQGDPPTSSLSGEGGVLGTFIIYLEPSNTSLKFRHIDKVRSWIADVLGPDDSHLYPLHCSLTSFFEIVAPRSALIRDGNCEVYLKAIYAGLRKATLSVEEMLFPSVIDDDETTSEGKKNTRAHRTNTTAIYEIKKGPIRNGTDNLNRGFVHVAEDGSVIAPLDISFLAKASLENGNSVLSVMCNQIREWVNVEVENAGLAAVVFRNSHGCRQLEAPIVKPGAHLTLLGRKGRSERLEEDDILKAASFLENAAAAALQTGEGKVMWDLNVRQVEKWGNSIDHEEHQFRTVAQIPKIACHVHPPRNGVGTQSSSLLQRQSFSKFHRQIQSARLVSQLQN